jgi:diguanylate cyclase (GGDEF)-like protein
MLLELGNPAERRTRAQVLDLALRTTLTLMEADAVAVLTPQNRRGERLVLHGGSSTAAAIQLPPKGSEVTRMLAEKCEPVVLGDLLDNARVAGGDGCPGVEAGPVLFTPVRQRNTSSAYIAVYRRRGRARFTMNDVRVMVLLGNWLGTALDNMRLATGTEKVAVTDDTTDVYNQRFLKTALNREIRRASRHGQELSLVLVALDPAPPQLVEQGEPARGGSALKELALVLAQQVRSFDVLGRNGDDAFMLILPQTPREGAAEVAERIRAAVEKKAFTGNAAGATTVSLGVASFPRDGADLNDLVSATERALDQARRRGPNRVATLERKAA